MSKGLWLFVCAQCWVSPALRLWAHGWSIQNSARRRGASRMCTRLFGNQRSDLRAKFGPRDHQSE
jgi:hypothetical protein